MHKNLTLNSMTLDITIETIHSNNLEFVLCEVEERKTRTRKTYLDELVIMTDKALGKLALVTQYDGHGDCWLLIERVQLKDVEKVLNIVDKTIGKWKNKFNVNKMIKNQD